MVVVMARVPVVVVPGPHSLLPCPVLVCSVSSVMYCLQNDALGRIGAQAFG